jgi:hypothetical protein
MTWRLHVVALVIVSLASTHDARAEALSRQRAWALAAAAVLAERNGALHDRLAGSYLTARDADEARRVLREWWGVTDRASLVKSLEWLQKSGHRERFAREGQQLAALTPAGRQALAGQRHWDLELNQKLGVVEMHYERLGKKSLIGWDLSRYIALCRWGYAAGYLTEADAWARIIPTARIIRHTFTSWRELGAPAICIARRSIVCWRTGTARGIGCRGRSISGRRASSGVSSASENLGDGARGRRFASAARHEVRRSCADMSSVETSIGR